MSARACDDRNTPESGRDTGLVVLREKLDARVLNGEGIQTTTYCRLSNSLRRVLTTLGLERVRQPIDITGTVIEHLRGGAA